MVVPKEEGLEGRPIGGVRPVWKPNALGVTRRPYRHAEQERREEEEEEREGEEAGAEAEEEEEEEKEKWDIGLILQCSNVVSKP